MNDPTLISRRSLLRTSAMAVGGLTLTAFAPRRRAFSLETRKIPGATGVGPHHAPRAKRIILIFMNGGPSQFESFDYKPELLSRTGQKGRRGQLMRPLYPFAQHGEGGIWVSDRYPHSAKQADRLCVLKGMKTGSSAHPLAIPLLHTGDFQFERPSFGSWVLYGLGNENPDLPGFVTIKPTRTFGGPSNYGSAFLPSTLQATRLGWEGRSLRNATIPHLSPPSKLAPEARRAALELAQQLNRQLLEGAADQASGVEGVIDSLELSEQMERALPEALDLERESPATRETYGIGGKRTDDFGRQCLLARRLSERGVRFVEIASSGWDHHSNIESGFARKALETDQPIAALLDDLAQRGLLEETLVLWTGEFGRQPDSQLLNGQKTVGRDHNATGFTAWVAGGGTRAGFSWGETDELGYEAVEGKVHMQDLHATLLHLLGLDHTRLTYRYGGRDFRLTNVSGEVVEGIIA